MQRDPIRRIELNAKIIGHLEKRIAVHRARLCFIPADCFYPEIWADIEAQRISAFEDQKARLIEENQRLARSCGVFAF